MSFADQYLIKHKPFIPFIEEPPSGLLSFIVVIPVYLEDKIISTLESIKDASPPVDEIEVVIVINYSADDNEENKKFNKETYRQLLTWCNSNTSNGLKFYPLLASDVPSKHAGAGMARKIGMDQAVQRFNRINREEGLILSLDADTLVSKNYFVALKERMFSRNGLNYGGCIINFEHPIEGNEYHKEIYDAVIQYELHLRYYKYALKYAGFPYYEYTIGSCFGVKAGLYAKHGGMNRRKAGEDFYFLHKIFPHTLFAFINGTCVYPSSRPSNRVPFGTGPVIAKMVENKDAEYLTYSPQAFIDLKELLAKIPVFYNTNSEIILKVIDSLPHSIRNFLNEYKFIDKVQEINANTAFEETFTKRFFQWFDGFMVVRFLNYSHQNIFIKLNVKDALVNLLKFNMNKDQSSDLKELLLFMRKSNKKNRNC